MSRIIYADLRRVIKKKNLWVFMILCSILMIIDHGKNVVLDLQNSFNFMVAASRAEGFTLMVGCVFLLAIYGDEFRSKALTTIIGRGFSRTRIVLVKFIDTVILTGFLFTFLFLFTLIIGLILRVHLSSTEIMYIVHSYIIAAYELIGNLTLAALFLYITENITLSVFVYVMLNMVVPLASAYARTLIVLIDKFNLDRYDYSAMGRMAFADLTFGITGDAILKLAIGAFYLAIVLLITIVFFNKKELDF